MKLIFIASVFWVDIRRDSSNIIHSKKIIVEFLKILFCFPHIILFIGVHIICCTQNYFLNLFF